MNARIPSRRAEFNRLLPSIQHKRQFVKGQRDEDSAPRQEHVKRTAGLKYASASTTAVNSLHTITNNQVTGVLSRVPTSAKPILPHVIPHLRVGRFTSSENPTLRFQFYCVCHHCFRRGVAAAIP